MRLDERIAELLSRHGSPLYVYDLDEVERRADELRAALPASAKIYYSLKANPFPPIVKRLKQLGFCLEVSSSRELAIALADDFPPSKILYTGPGKGEGEIQHALRAGVTYFSCESFLEWKRLARAAEIARKSCRILFRINPTVSGVPGLAMSGISSKFGMDESEFIERILPAIGPEGYCQPCGLHIYYGTQTRDLDALAKSFEEISGIAARIADRGKFAMEVVDFGGGFPWPFAESGPSPSIPPFPASVFAPLGPSRSLTDLWFESGRFLVASSGTLIATVVDIKESKGRNYVILDAGINHFGGMAGLGRLHVPKISPLQMKPADSLPDFKADIVGPLCSPLDILGRDVEMRKPEIGERILIPNVGAYGLTASLLAFLGRELPAEIAIGPGDKVECARMDIKYTGLKEA